MSFSKGFKVWCVDNSAEKACYDSSAIRLIFAPFVLLSFSFVWFSTHYSFHACAQITFTSVYLICQGTLSFMNIDNVHYCIMNVRLTVPNIYIGYCYPSPGEIQCDFPIIFRISRRSELLIVMFLFQSDTSSILEC